MISDFLPDSSLTGTSLLALLLVIATLLPGAEGGEPIAFDTDVVPVLTKLGCNAGACHGSASGRGGFHLSLYGSQPASDYLAITRQAKGRRIQLGDVEQSLLLRKPGGEMAHGGGQRFTREDEARRILKTWIEQGARRRELRSLVELDVGATTNRLEPNSEYPLRATAKFDDGTHRDVTEWTLFTSNDETAVSIDESTHRAQVLRPGRHIVLARYLDRIVPIEFLVPQSTASDEQDGATSPFAKNNFIDKFVNSKLRRLGITPAETSKDAVFLRRVTLDLTGRLPTVNELESFLADSSPGKRARVIERLMASDAFVDYWTYQLAELLRIRSRRGAEAATTAYVNWLRAQVQSNRPWDEMVSELVMAKGDSQKNGPANFYRTTGDARAQAEFLTESLLGVRLRCANCHDHPLDRWTQDDYHGLAAIFAKVDQGRIVKIKAFGENIHPATGETARPKIPGQRFLAGEPSQHRQELLDWMLKDENPYFAKAIVNRLWRALVGRGLVEPVDDFRSTNPPTHPQLLNELARDFEAHGYDLRHTIRVIANSAAYQRGNDRGRESPWREEFYADAVVQPLSAEVLSDAIGDVTGVRESFGKQSRETRAVELYDAAIEAPSLDILGRCDRTASCESVGGGGSSPLRRQLHLLNGPLINRKLENRQGRLARLIDEGKTNAEIVRSFYLRAFSRPPSKKEREFWSAQFDDGTRLDGGRSNSEIERRQQLEDFVWSLLNSREFSTRH